MTAPAPLSPAELKTARQALALSQAALARRLGVLPGAVLRWERGVRSPPPYLRLALCWLNWQTFMTEEVIDRAALGIRAEFAQHAQAQMPDDLSKRLAEAALYAALD